MIDHDAVFKQLLDEFFVEFLDLFCPDALALIDPTQISFLDKELFADLVDPDRREADIIARVGIAGREAFFIIHLEHQAQEDRALDRRMFRYFARLYERYDVPIYPIALCSYPAPRRAVADRHVVAIADLPVLHFQYRTVQLNRLDWRAYLRNDNPLAAALMARMRIATADQMQVKVACLSRILGMPLSPRRRRLLARFVTVYLSLPSTQEQQVQVALAMQTTHTEEAMQDIAEIARQVVIANAEYWNTQRLVQLLLTKRFGPLEADVIAQLERLPIERLELLIGDQVDFTDRGDLIAWLADHGVPAVDDDEDEDNAPSDTGGAGI
jgi:Domain of unknown function (DUF4351)/Putative transposase, YhgA-like